ncbi:MAG: ribosome maturation factor RimM [Henriciella sp.]|uniref:ribosome maturation factor RimM n=1 Tax=Henriciella sp. TaxID=1968823 RepID=UPI0032EE6635
MSKANDPQGRLIVVGVISGAHGVRGDVRVKSFTEDADALFDYGALLSKSGEPLVEAKAVRPAKDHFIVTPKQPRQKEEWDTLKGALLHVPRSQLPAPEDDEFYIEDLVGLSAVDRAHAPAGSVKAVHDFGAGDLLEILPAATGEPSYYVPFTLEDVPEVSFERGEVVIADAQKWADRSGRPEDETGA